MSDTRTTPSPPSAGDLLSSHCPIRDHTPDFADGSRMKRCDGCDTPVHNLSAMTQAEADALIDTDERVCVRYEVGPSGHPVYQAAIASGFGLALSMVAACGGSTTEAVPTPAEPAVETSTASETNTSPSQESVQKDAAAPPKGEPPRNPKDSKANVFIGKVRRPEAHPSPTAEPTPSAGEE